MNGFSGKKVKVRQSRFPVSLFWIFFGVCSLMSGLHQGLIVLMQRWEWNDVVQTHIALFYWALVAAVITLHVWWRMKKTYEIPLQLISDATQKVAQGDFSVYITPIHTMDKLDYLDMMIMDINKMVEELGSIETLKTDFVSNVSHEMKTPIAVIKNYAELLQMAGVSEEQRKEYSESIENAAVRLSDLITNILKMNKLENQRITPEMITYDMCRQVCECILQFEKVLDEKEIELDTVMDDTAMIKADPKLMELVWNNLFSNAIKFTQPGGTVSISQSSDEKYVKIAVSDTGCGMSSESMEHIFDKFYQGDLSHAKEGNGLGLALVKRVLELMEGDIQVSSKEGVGSVFTVTMPAVMTNAVHGGE